LPEKRHSIPQLYQGQGDIIDNRASAGSQAGKTALAVFDVTIGDVQPLHAGPGLCAAVQHPLHQRGRISLTVRTPVQRNDVHRYLLPVDAIRLSSRSDALQPTSRD